MTNQIKKLETYGAEIFKEDGKIKPILEALKAEALALVFDAETEQGRKEMRKLSRSIGGAITKLDGTGKDFVADAKAQIKKVDARRKELKDGAEEIKKAVTAPADAWQAKEDARVAAITDKIKRITELGLIVNIYGQPLNLEALQIQLKELNAMPFTESDFSEFLEGAKAEAQKTAEILKGQIAIQGQIEADRKVAEAERKEAERLRIREEERAKLQAENEKLLLVGQIATDQDIAPQPQTQTNTLFDMAIEIDELVKDEKPAYEQPSFGHKQRRTAETKIMLIANVSRYQASLIVEAVEAGKIDGLGVVL